MKTGIFICLLTIISACSFPFAEGTSHEEEDITSTVSSAILAETVRPLAVEAASAPQLPLVHLSHGLVPEESQPESRLKPESGIQGNRQEEAHPEISLFDQHYPNLPTNHHEASSSSSSQNAQEQDDTDFSELTAKPSEHKEPSEHKVPSEHKEEHSEHKVPSEHKEEHQHIAPELVTHEALSNAHSSEESHDVEEQHHKISIFHEETAPAPAGSGHSGHEPAVEHDHFEDKAAEQEQEEESSTSHEVQGDDILNDDIHLRAPNSPEYLDDSNVTYAEVHHINDDEPANSTSPTSATATTISSDASSNLGNSSSSSSSSSATDLTTESSSSGTENVNGTTWIYNSTTEAPSTTVSSSDGMMSGSESNNTDSSSSASSTSKPPKKKPPYNAVLNCRCGTQSTKRVELGAIKADVSIYPWTVLINSTNKQSCAGNIINSKFILTSASCLQGQAPKDLSILGALAMSENNTVAFTPERISIHPSYNPSTQDNNLALIEVRETIHPSKYVKFICLPIDDSSSDDNATGTLVTVARDLETRDTVMVQEQVKRIPGRRCESLSKRSIPPNSFCSAPPSKHCDMGDGGSYVVPGKGYSFALKGLVYSSGCKRRAKPTVYTMVERYTKWILYKTRSASYCKAPSFRAQLANLPEHNTHM